MNYQKHYDALMNRAKNRLLEGYCETHHIIPRCMGGKNDEDNLVDLTAEEHYIAHQLLVKIYPHNFKLVYAANMMTCSSHVNVRNNKLYGWIRRKMSEANRGNKNPMFGKPSWNKDKTCSDETKRKISEANRGNKNPMFGKTPWNKGETLSDETKRKMSEASKGQIPWNKGKTLSPLSDEHKRKISETIKARNQQSTLHG